MKAAGEHLIVRIPPKKQVSEGGIVLDVVDQRRMYGRILSIGPKAKAELGESNIGSMSHVVFDISGAITLTIDPTKDKSEEVALHWTAILAMMTDQDVLDWGVPLAP